jgi:hypothetical protein
LGIAKTSPVTPAQRARADQERVSQLFNQSFYNAIPLFLTNRTSEAFKEIGMACSLALHCMQHSPYWIYLRLLRLYSYPLWNRFPDVRSQIIVFLRALASRTLHDHHPLRRLLQVWNQGGIGTDAERISSLLRLSCDIVGPNSGLAPDEWAWIQDELCSLSYQRRDLYDVRRIARKLTEEPTAPLGVHITSKQMIARCHLHHGEFQEAENILIKTFQTCESFVSEHERSRYLQQTYSDLGYIYHVRGDRNLSLGCYDKALVHATRVNNIANISSVSCRVATLIGQEDKSKERPDGVPDHSWALWAFCRPYS